MKIWNALTLSLLFVAISNLPLQAQKWGKRESVSGEGAVVTQTLDINKFESIGLALNAKVILTQGNTQKVTIQGQQNIIDLIEKEVDDDSWDIGFGNNYNVRNYEKLIINITMPNFEKLAIAGAGEIESNGPFNNLGNVKMAIAGSGDIDISGAAKGVKIEIAGSGRVDLADLSSGDCDVEIAGSGDCKVNVSGDLEVSIAGSGSVAYKGQPRLSTSIAGSGSVRSLR
ncbi:MAG: head GIN domain-containing protein [Saprospiraceae bacterium]